jgi:uncharacterized membrane protein
MDEQIGPRRSAARILLGAGVVFLGVAAVLVALAIVLNHYPVQPPDANGTGQDRSSAVVAVMTPVVAAIAGIVGLYFGISATGSARGQQAGQAQATANAARSIAEAARSTSEAATVAQQASLARAPDREPVRVPDAGAQQPGGGPAA